MDPLPILFDAQEAVSLEASLIRVLPLIPHSISIPANRERVAFIGCSPLIPHTVSGSRVLVVIQAAQRGPSSGPLFGVASLFAVWFTSAVFTALVQDYQDYIGKCGMTLQSSTKSRKIVFYLSLHRIIRKAAV
jgi:hypothetical protein